MVRVAADRAHAALHVGVEAPGRPRSWARRRRPPPPSRRRSACPPRTTPAWTMTGQPCGGRAMLTRAADRQLLALVAQHMHPRRVHEDAAGLVADEGVVGEAVPEAGDDVEEFARPLVALAMRHVLVMAEIQRGIGVGGGHEVPGRAPAADVVQRGELPRHVPGVVVGGGRRGDQPDPLRHHGQRREQGQRLEAGDRVAALQRLDRHVQHGVVVGHEEGVELRRLQRLDEAHHVLQVEIRVRRRRRGSARPRCGCWPGA